MNTSLLRKATTIACGLIVGGAAIEGWLRAGQLREANARLRRYVASSDKRLVDSYRDKTELAAQVRTLESKVADLTELIDPETNPTLILRERILTVLGNADKPLTRGQLKTRLSAPQRGRADGELSWLIGRGYVTDTDGALATTDKQWHAL